MRARPEWTSTRPGLATMLLLGIALAGCVSGTDGPADASDPPGATGWEYYTDDFFPTDVDHDHTDMANHTTSKNVEFVAFHDCTEDGVYDADTTGSFTDIKERGDYVFVGQSDGFCILDISDPSQPQFVSHYEAETSYDTDVSADGNWVFHATQRNNPSGVQPAPGANAEKDLPRGLYVVDVSDKADPTFASFYPMPTNGVHTVHYFKHPNGDDIVLLQTYDWVPPSEAGVSAPTAQANAPQTQRVEITRLEAQPDGAMGLTRLSVYTLERPSDEPLAYWFPHDCTAQQHPMTQRTLMYCAYWDAGMVIVDITDPVNPTFVSRYADAAPSQYNQYHYALPVDGLIDGRHITVAAPELQLGVGESGYVRIFDTSDPAAPEQIGAWTLPGDTGFGGGFLYSPHQFDVFDGKIVIGHNHAGVWVIDISDAEKLVEPQSAAFYFPHGDERLTPDEWSSRSSVWVAVEHAGYLYSVETSSGVHIHRFVGDA